MDKWFSNPTVLKVVALILAIMLWLVVNLDDSPTNDTVRNQKYTINDVEVSARYDMDQFAIVQMTDQVTVELTGPSTMLNPITIPPDSYQVYVDATDLDPGSYRLPVEYEGFPANVFVTIKPAFIDITLERKEQSQKTVGVQLIGETAEGYAAGTPVVNPLKVHVVAPESTMKQIAQIVATVNMENVTETVNKTVPVQAIDAQGNVVEAEINPSVVDVTVPVSSPYTSLPLRIETEGRPAEGYSILSVEPGVNQITVYGPLDVINGMDFYPGPGVDTSGLSGDRVFEVRIPQLDGVDQTDPEFVEVLVRVAETTEITLEDVPITINGINNGQRVEFVDPEEGRVTLTFRGAAQNVNGLQPADIEAYIDVSNLAAGEREVPLQLNLPPYIETGGDEPETITIRVLDGNDE